jgi:hypothetical protein
MKRFKLTNPKIPERIIEDQGLTWLSYQKNLFAFKVKDQAQFVNGQYRRPSKYCINGVSDIIVMIKNGPVLFIEIKTREGFQSRDQKYFQKICEEMGHRYHLARSLDDIRKIINQYNPNP